MANLNYWNGSLWIGGGLTWNYSYGPTDARFNDIWIAPDPASNASGNVEILRKWSVASPQEIIIMFEVRNNSPDPVWFAWNVIDVAP
jgi:hypothetical protein